MKLLSTADAAQRLNVSRQRVQALVAEGRLKATKVGRGYVIREADLLKLERKPPYRPKKHPARRGQ